MEVRIKATDFDLTPETSEYLSERTSAIEKILGSESYTARLEIEIAKASGNQRHGDNAWKAEMNLMYPGGRTIRATNHAPNVNAAIDDAKEELVRQVRTEKQTHRRMIRQTGAAIKRWMRFGASEAD